MIDFVSGVKFQIASLCFVLLVVVDFVRSKRIKTLTTRIFSGLLATVTVYILSDILTVYTILNFTNDLINEIAHRVFYFLLLTSVFMFSAYVEFVGNSRNKEVSTIASAVWILPYLICSVGIFVGSLEYVVFEKGVYSMGFSTYSLYAGIAIYLIVNFIETFRYKEIFSRKKRFALRLQMFIWIVVAVVQFTHPYILLSALGISISTVALYFSFENPNENIDEETGAFNKKAFDMSFFEQTNCIGQKPVHLLTLVIEDKDIISSSIGFNRYNELVKLISDTMKLTFGTAVYRTKSDMISVIYPRNNPGFKEKITALKNTMEKGFCLKDAEIQPNTHIVIMECPEITSEPEEIYELVLHGSRFGGSDFVRMVDESVVEKKNRTDTLNKMIVAAIENDGFDVVYQPIYSTEKKAFVSSEALVRFKDKETIGFVSPEEFIPLAEKNGYIIKIGEIVFEKVCRTIQTLKEKNIPIEYIEVNLSALQSIDEKVPDAFSEIMKKYGVKPCEVNLEITETTAVESAVMLERNMKKFRKMGCSFSMDDFGTGYSNLQKMAEIKYDLVKLDKSLIWSSFGENPKDESVTILKNSVRMVTGIGSHIVAEGVETEEMVNGLTKMGVQYLQGYYFSKPISEEAYIEFLAEKMCV